MKTKPVYQRSVVFPKPMMEWLEKRSEKLSISIAEVIRRLIDEKREQEM